MFAGSYRWFTILGCVLSALHAILEMLTLVSIWFVIRDLLRVAPNWSQAGDIGRYAWWAMGFAIAAAVLYFAGISATHLSAFRSTSNIRKTAMAHLASLPLGWFTQHASGETRRIVDGAVEETHAVMAHRLPDLSAAATTPVAFLIVSFVFDWRMGLACLLPAIISMFCMIMMLNSGAGSGFMKRYQDALDTMNKAAVEYVRGIPVVKTFQQTVYSFRAFRTTIGEYRNMAQAYSFACQPWQVVQLVAINGTFALLVPLAILISNNTGDFTGFLTDFLFYALFSTVTVMMMTKVMYASEAFMQADDAMRRIHTILDAKPLPHVRSGEEQPPHGSGIAFEHVSFTYAGSDHPALDDVSFTVPGGSTVALVGPSGSGKTTLAYLVPRFWDPNQGAVRIGGVDVRAMGEATLMNEVAFVFQNDRLFSESLLENIRHARPNATRVEVEAAAHAAQCDDIIAKFPDGLDTIVGTHGVYLSGGESQRITLARAICKNSPIVVLDEATAFADPDNEAKIQRAFEQLSKGKTVLMIAHRLSTVRDADRIVVLGDGKVRQIGRHDELLAANGEYAAMWNEYERSVTWTVDNDSDGTRPGTRTDTPEAGNSAGDRIAEAAPATNSGKESR